MDEANSVSGEDKASWYCVWIDPEGSRRKKSCGSGKTGKRIAERMKDRIKAELLTGTYNREEKKTWKGFRDEYERRILPGMKSDSADQYRYTLDRFEHLCKPKLISTISKRDIDKFLEKRRKERGRKPKLTVEVATLNRDLGNLRTILKVAAEWEYLESVPKIKLLKKPKRLPNYVTIEHFDAMYGKCDVAKSPADLPYGAADWWRGLLVMAMMTGWRIGELLSLKWTDVDLDEGTAITHADDNKGNRTEKVALHPVVIEHLQVIRGFDDLVFPWPKSRRQAYAEFKTRLESGFRASTRATQPMANVPTPAIDTASTTSVGPLRPSTLRI